MIRTMVLPCMNDSLYPWWPKIWSLYKSLNVSELIGFTYFNSGRCVFSDCMNMYGSDKPDLRIKEKICDVTQIMTSDKTSTLGTTIFGSNASLRVKCVKFECASFKQHPNTQYLNKELADILKK